LEYCKGGSLGAYVAGAETATNEVYKSYRDCGDLSNFSLLNVGISVARTYLGGKLVVPAAKGHVRIRAPGPQGLQPSH
jgi:hypothetical protein